MLNFFSHMLHASMHEIPGFAVKKGGRYQRKKEAIFQNLEATLMLQKLRDAANERASGAH